MNNEWHTQDPAVWQAVQAEASRQANVIELIASENIASQAVRAVQSSVLTNKYAVGYPGARIYPGNEAIDRIDEIARTRAQDLFGAEYANVFPHSGTQANQAVYAAFLQPGDRILAMSEHAGGHFTHGQAHNFSGQLYDAQFYGVDPTTERLDYAQIERQARAWHPRIIIAGASAYSQLIDWERFRAIADEVGAYLMVDMAHIAGLVAGQVLPSPVPVADVVTSTTHKTLRGPRGGMILAKRQYGAQIDQAVFPRSQSGTLEQIVAAKAIAYREAQQPEFRQYAEQVVQNAQLMARILHETPNVRVVTGGTVNHELTLDVRATGLTGAAAADRLYSVGIATNQELLPLETGRTMGGIRLGTPTITSRNFTPAAVSEVATLIGQVLNHPSDLEQLDQIRQAVQRLTAQFPVTR
ncbi:serine hydroxymethyltransferase [Fructilactobacillus myrtifloralis]|uniref:Serine hydroxymethyltransferase n=1 Tax=Fructilactobacillus myrtifloralis TaxID=2940301 RepID=A0ABY5BR44_9LACO|nr:serine hydroxymethyltransferase [Fructilactobacillus myrtifloralis]USS85720.1 serine hydroxymethyltransferase [Fructilactobacillus myrtifloralis]